MHPEREANPNATRPKVKDKDHDAMIKKAWKAGWWARQTGKSKVMCYAPEDDGMVLVPNTPSDHYSVLHHRKLFARHGLKV